MAMFTRSGKPQQTPSSETEAKEPQQPAQPSGREARQKPVSGKGGEPSVISSALTITGDLESAGDVQIDGMVEGDVRAQAVKIGDGAKIRGSVFGEAVELAGSVEGKIEADNVSIAKTGHMHGDIVHKTLQVESGAFIDGHVRSQSGGPGRQSGGGPSAAQGTQAASSGASSSASSAASSSGASSTAASGASSPTKPGEAGKGDSDKPSGESKT
jgi:cytoskeletal protein CcmA (bactofilin family)